MTNRPTDDEYSSYIEFCISSHEKFRSTFGPLRVTPEQHNKFVNEMVWITDEQKLSECTLYIAVEMTIKLFSLIPIVDCKSVFTPEKEGLRGLETTIHDKDSRPKGTQLFPTSLVTGTVLLIASKYEEEYPRNLKETAKFLGYSWKDMKTCERLILKVLDYSIPEFNAKKLLRVSLQKDDFPLADILDPHYFLLLALHSQELFFQPIRILTQTVTMMGYFWDFMAKQGESLLPGDIDLLTSTAKKIGPEFEKANTEHPYARKRYGEVLFKGTSSREETRIKVKKFSGIVV